MKRLIFILGVFILMGSLGMGQNPIPQLDNRSGPLTPRERKNVSKAINQTNLNKDTAEVHRVDINSNSAVIDEHHPVFPDTIDMDDYLGSTPYSVIISPNYETGSYKIKNKDGYFSRLNWLRDSVVILEGTGNRWSSIDQHDRIFRTEDGVLMAAAFYPNKDYKIIQNYLTDKSAGDWFIANEHTTFLNPQVGDSISITNFTNTFLSWQSNVAGDDSINVDYGVILDLHSTVDDKLQLDSFNVIHIGMDWDADEDSLTVFKVIYNENVDPPTAEGKVYFLYSEYGDIYSAGDLEFTGAIKQTQLTAALTDGAPTDAQIDAATSLTPATAGAGYSVTILDSDGSGLLYRIESDGTYWQYQVLTIAL